MITSDVVGCQKPSECNHTAIQELMEGISYGFQSIPHAYPAIITIHW